MLKEKSRKRFEECIFHFVELKNRDLATLSKLCYFTSALCNFHFIFIFPRSRGARGILKTSQCNENVTANVTSIHISHSDIRCYGERVSGRYFRLRKPGEMGFILEIVEKFSRGDRL